MFRVIRFRHTGESIPSEDEVQRQEEVVQVMQPTNSQSEAFADGTPVPREFANPTDGKVFPNSILHSN